MRNKLDTAAHVSLSLLFAIIFLHTMQTWLLFPIWFRQSPNFRNYTSSYEVSTPRMSNGMIWPESSIVNDVSEARQIVNEYHQLQATLEWSGHMAMTLEQENPDVCVMSPMTTYAWGSKFYSTSLSRLENELQNCRQQGKTLYIAPISIISNYVDAFGFKMKSTGHANILFINETRGRVERFDPNGATTYPGSGYFGKQDMFSQKTLDNHLSNFAYDQGLLLTVPTNAPVQMIENFDKTMPFDGFCEAWVHWYLQVKLLNRDMDTDDLNRKIMNFVSKHGKQVILSFIKANIQRYNRFKNKLSPEAVAEFRLNSDSLWKVSYNMYKEGYGDVSIIPTIKEKEQNLFPRSFYWKLQSYPDIDEENLYAKQIRDVTRYRRKIERGGKYRKRKRTFRKHRKTSKRRYSRNKR